MDSIVAAITGYEYSWPPEVLIGIAIALALAAIALLCIAAFGAWLIHVGVMGVPGNQCGIVGQAIYGACWIFLFPFMLAACVIVGGTACWIIAANWKAERDWKTGRRTQWWTVEEWQETRERTARANAVPSYRYEGDFPQ